jgi:hypothetical protein
LRVEKLRVEEVEMLRIKFERLRVRYLLWRQPQLSTSLKPQQLNPQQK